MRILFVVDTELVGTPTIHLGFTEHKRTLHGFVLQRRNMLKSSGSKIPPNGLLSPLTLVSILGPLSLCLSVLHCFLWTTLVTVFGP